jgi:hypothetical protein
MAVYYATEGGGVSVAVTSGLITVFALTICEAQQPARPQSAGFGTVVLKTRNAAHGSSTSCCQRWAVAMANVALVNQVITILIDMFKDREISSMEHAHTLLNRRTHI